MLTLSHFFQKQFWLKIWVWCKVNWKFILGLSIPILVSILLRRGKTTEIIAKGQEMKAKHLEAELEAHGLKTELENLALEKHVESVKAAERQRHEDLKNLEDEIQKNKERLSSPEKATEALAEKFNLDNLDER